LPGKSGKKKKGKKGKKKKGVKKTKEIAPPAYVIPEILTPFESAPKVDIEVTIAEPFSDLFKY